MLPIGAQVFIAVAMLDVWLFRHDRPRRSRGGDARTRVEEFRVYGLLDRLRQPVRLLKLGAGVLLIIGIWHPPAALVSGAGLAVLVAVSISMHIRVHDPLHKALPATLFFSLSCLVAYAHRVPLTG